MSKDSYLSFCPVAKACEVLEPRWTLLVLCEMFNGASRFNEIHRGLAGMSPTLLSRRLKEMEQNGLVTRTVRGVRGEITYGITAMADELRPVVLALGKWAHRNVDRDVSLEHLDARLLMWNVRRKTRMELMPPARQWVIQFTYPDLPPEDARYWMVARPETPTDLCMTDPAQEVDLYVRADLRAMTSVFLGYSTIPAEIARGAIELIGDVRLARAMSDWFVPTMYAAA